MNGAKGAGAGALFGICGPTPSGKDAFRGPGTKGLPPDQGGIVAALA